MVRRVPSRVGACPGTRRPLSCELSALVSPGRRGTRGSSRWRRLVLGQQIVLNSRENSRLTLEIARRRLAAEGRDGLGRGRKVLAGWSDGRMRIPALADAQIHGLNMEMSTVVTTLEAKDTAILHTKRAALTL